MYAKIIAGGLLIIPGLIHSQVWSGPISPLTTTYRNGNVGIGMLSTPSTNYKLHVDLDQNNPLDGVYFGSNSHNDVKIFMRNNTSGGANWVMKTYGSGSPVNAWRLENLNNGIVPVDVYQSGQTVLTSNPGGLSPANAQLTVRADYNKEGIRVDNWSAITSNISDVQGFYSVVNGNSSIGSAGTGIYTYVYKADINKGGSFVAEKGSVSKGISAIANEATTNYGGYFEGNSILTTGLAFGIEANANSRNAASIGVSGNASGGGAGYYHYGGHFTSVDAASDRNLGAQGFATGGKLLNIGLSGVTNTLSLPNPMYFSTANYPQSFIGVYGTACLNPGSYVTPSNQWAGWFDNDVMINGTGYNTSFGVFTSDRRFKRDITSITEASSIISQLNPSTYYMNTDNEFGLNFSNKKQYGFISQEVEKVLPDLVTNVFKPTSVDKDGKEITKEVEFKGLNYMGFIALLTKGIQEQQALIHEQQKQLDEQKLMIAELNNKVTTSTGINTLSNIETGLTMSQNEPNPFTHETVVNYTLPGTVTNAFMAIYDLTGKQITTFPIHETGSSALTITSEKLSAGIYIYSIVADGKVVDSKRMIVAEK